MGTMLAQPPIPAFHAIPPVLRNRPTKMAVAAPSFLSATHQWTQSTRFGQCPFEFRTTYTVRVAEQSSSLIGDETPTKIKTLLYQALEGTFFKLLRLRLPYFEEVGENFEVKIELGYR